MVLLERLPDAILQSTVDQKTEGHDHHQRHNALWRLEEQGMRHEPGVFQKAEAAFDLRLARRRVIQHVFVTELGFIQRVAGKNKAAFVLNLAVPRFEYRGDTRVNAIGDNIG